MTVLVLACLVAILFAIGSVLLHYLGWPYSVENAGRWGVALLVLSALSSALPSLLVQFESIDRFVPRISLVDLLAPALILGMTALGYHAWNQGASNARARASLVQPPAQRRRALPPAPRSTGDASFVPLDVEDDHHD
jgi:hypothetical protein